MSALAHVLWLVRIDVRRTVRKHTDWQGSAGQVVAAAVFGVLVGLVTVGGGYLAYRFGGALAGGEVAIDASRAITTARGVVAVAGVVLSAVIAVRAVGQRGTLTNAEGVLTVVPTREALVGVVASEYVYVLLWLGGPAIGLGVGLAAGTGTVWPALTMPLGVAVTAVVPVAVGYPLGLAIRHLVSRFAFVARNKGPLIVVVFLVYVAAIATGQLNAAIVALFEPLQASPTGWPADLLFFGLPSLGASPVLALGSVGVSALVAAAGIAAGERLASAHWFSDPVLAGETDHSDREPSTTSDTPGLDRRLEQYVDGPTAALATLAWRRAVRAPLKLLYAAYPLLFAVGWVADVVQTGTVPSELAVGTLVFVTWAAGVIFTLNPLGDQGSVLPVTLLSRVDGTQFVRAHLLASLVVAIPAGTLLTAGAAVLSPFDTTDAVVLVGSAPVLMIAGSALSVGVGMAFPRFQAVTVTRSVKAVVPSMVAFVLFTLHLVATTTSAVLVYSVPFRSLAAGLLTWALPFGLAVAPPVLYRIAAVALVVLTALPALSYSYAVRRFDSYTLS